MISRYLDAALHRARYSRPEDGVFCGTVPGLRGVIATAAALEGCRNALAEVIEEWILVRVARGLDIPALGAARVQVRKVS